MPLLDVDAATWSALNRLLDEALDLPPAERERWLARLPEAARALAPRLRALLSRAGDESLGRLPRLGTVAGEEEEPGEPGATAGDVIGPYRLVRLLAEGGMGAVWLGERADGMVQRPVAVKLLHGSWQRAALAERMAREREILAALGHPHIARLYDAGVTEEGLPWLALEYVEGRHLDAWLRDERPVLRARLGLFLQVARAVAHAHAHLVIHRDLKPSNILVTAEGEARLLDFGIAKILEQGSAEETELTRLGGRALTPGYASPEQIAGHPLGVASDVYSLGVVLFEMLTGARPYELARDTPAALEEAILSTEPRRPSEAARDPAQRRALRGDLDTVVRMALRKRPEDRYPTANAFAEDVERWLGGRPVAAQPDSRAYRLRKLVGRNKLAFGAGLAVALAVLAGAGVSLWQARVARAEQRRAEEVKEFIASVFREADPYAGRGRTLSAADLLGQARERISRRLGPGSAMRVELLGIVGASLNGLEDYQAAEQALTQAAEEGTRALGALHPMTLRARVALLEPRRMLGKTRELQEEIAALSPHLERIARESPRDRIKVVEHEAHLALDEGRYADGERFAREAFDLAAQALGERDEYTGALSGLLSVAYSFTHKRAEALEAAERALRSALAVHDDDPRHPGVVDARMSHGHALAEVGRLDDGIAEMGRAVDDAVAALGPESAMVGFFSGRLAENRVAAGDVAQALKDADRHLAILTRTAVPGSYNFASTLALHGAVLLAARRAEAALPELTRAADGLAQALGAGHDQVYSARLDRALALAYLGDGAGARRQLDDAEREHTGPARGREHKPLFVAGVLRRLAGEPAEAVRLHAAALGAVAPGPAAGRKRMGILAEKGLAELDAGADREALESLGAALEASGRLQSHPSPLRADVLVGLGRALMSQGKPKEALPLLQRADAFWRDLDPGSRWAGEAALRLGKCFEALGRRNEAREALARARVTLARSPIPADARLLRLARLPVASR
ncbi:MAG TPA: protein kinase [Anaeromyxobacteraceae bacterium]|nr:protein kinase [Anaeromyxobacteraceae bacterium]